VPVNGLRHPPKADATGWYIWAGAGDSSSEPDFFVPPHELFQCTRLAKRWKPSSAMSAPNTHQRHEGVGPATLLWILFH
jgi:hypothetical protein